jgi:pyruvate dehydrogenase E2 component (dihydrolipoamide acetyltransferase)
VVVDQPLVSVETDKAVVEVPSPYSGTISALHGASGDIIPVSHPLADFDETVQADKGSVVGSMPATPDTIEDRDAEYVTQARVKAMPAVRALARKLGVDLLAVDATAPDNSITAEDVERYARAMASGPAAEPMRGVRRAMAHKIAQAHAEIAPAAIYDEADVEAWIDNGDVTVRLVHAVVAGCRASPTLNAWYSAQDMALRINAKIDLGIAINTDDGLFVAVMRDVANRDDADLRLGLDALKRDVTGRTIPLEETRGATITLSNFGVFGVGRFAHLVVVPPQVAIVGAGPIKPRPVVVNGALTVHRTLPLSLTFDHRVATGMEAARFLKAMLEALGSA